MFDPAAGMRVMADIQAEGLRAAGELLERMLGSEQAPTHNGHRTVPSAGDYAVLLDAWADLIRAFIGGVAEPGDLGALTVPVDGGDVRRPLRLGSEKAGCDSATAEVWFRNDRSSAVGPFVLRCSDLRNSEGKRLKRAKVRFKPRTVTLEPRSSRAVKVSLRTKDEPRPGLYRGTIQAEGAPNLWLPVEVAIEPC